ncbi:alcohol dehydrogenase-like 7 isoform X1 [Canna indica]|uniref:Alcohol dehydrogenase-like 7 isoform X1 n=1 Tax=Canna indica TaxID=4628 RepID=A0AAQ3K6E6_9LILI|nr:alcohol dehydrogenase-like 7 isoform X1 [Canna indica]
MEMKPIRCKAAVCRAAGEPLQLEEVVVAPPKAHEARVKIICSTLCHSDLTFWRMQGVPGLFPIILGHEAIGVVESVGEGVTEVAAGDVVLPVCLAQCGDCPDCNFQRSNMCSGLPLRPLQTAMPRDGTTRFTDAAGEAVHHFLNVSSFSEYTVVDVAHLVKVDQAVPPQIACVLSCGITTGIGATWRAAEVHKGSSVAVFGLGAVGLAVAEGARFRGATKIIGVDLNPLKFEIGKKFGVTDFVNPNEIGDRSISEVIKEMTGGGADYCFECVGSSALVTQAFLSSRRGCGKTVILGLDGKGTPITIDPNELLAGRTILGTCIGGVKPKSDIPVLIDHYMNKEIHLDEFITHEIGFSEINKAFDLLIQGKSIRCTIWMDK